MSEKVSLKEVVKIFNELERSVDKDSFDSETYAKWIMAFSVASRELRNLAMRENNERSDDK